MKQMNESGEELAEALWLSTIASKDLQGALAKLNSKAQRALYLRFWGVMTIEEIAKDLHLSWDEADALITNSIELLREFMLGKKTPIVTSGAA